jgi:hypothetical protein
VTTWLAPLGLCSWCATRCRSGIGAGSAPTFCSWRCPGGTRAGTGQTITHPTWVGLAVAVDRDSCPGYGGSCVFVEAGSVGTDEDGGYSDFQLWLNVGFRAQMAPDVVAVYLIDESLETLCRRKGGDSMGITRGTFSGPPSPADRRAYEYTPVMLHLTRRRELVRGGPLGPTTACMPQLVPRRRAAPCGGQQYDRPRSAGPDLPTLSLPPGTWRQPDRAGGRRDTGIVPSCRAWRSSGAAMGATAGMCTWASARWTRW